MVLQSQIAYASPRQRERDRNFSKIHLRHISLEFTSNTRNLCLSKQKVVILTEPPKQLLDIPRVWGAFCPYLYTRIYVQDNARKLVGVGVAAFGMRGERDQTAEASKKLFLLFILSIWILLFFFSPIHKSFSPPSVYIYKRRLGNHPLHVYTFSPLLSFKVLFAHTQECPIPSPFIFHAIKSKRERLSLYFSTLSLCLSHILLPLPLPVEFLLYVRPRGPNLPSLSLFALYRVPTTVFSLSLWLMYKVKLSTAWNITESWTFNDRPSVLPKRAEMSKRSLLFHKRISRTNAVRMAGTYVSTFSFYFFMYFTARKEVFFLFYYYHYVNLGIKR